MITINVDMDKCQHYGQCVFEAPDVFKLNDDDKLEFVATADATASSGAWSSVSISPPIYTSTNALATVDSFPADNAAVTFLGAASTSYAQNLVYQKNAITFATADLLLPQGVDMASRQVHNGISMRIVRQYDINNDRMPCRIDVLYGYSVIRAPMAVRMWG